MSPRFLPAVVAVACLAPTFSGQASPADSYLAVSFDGASCMAAPRGLSSLLMATGDSTCVGWAPANGAVRYVFLAKNRLLVGERQRNSGEKIFEGVWYLNGDQITLAYGHPRRKVTFNISRDGNDLLIGNELFSRVFVDL